MSDKYIKRKEYFVKYNIERRKQLEQAKKLMKIVNIPENRIEIEKLEEERKKIEEDRKKIEKEFENIEIEKNKIDQLNKKITKILELLIN